MTDEVLIAEKIAEIAATADQYPCVVIIHHVPTQTVRYLSEWGLRLLGTTLEDARALGPRFSPTYFNAVESDEYMARVFALMYEQGNPEVHSFYQQVKTTERAEWDWYLTSMRCLLRNAADAPLLVMGMAVPLHPDNHFGIKVKRLIKENQFLREHNAAFAALTPRERGVLRLLAQGCRSPEIADVLFISPQTADTHRRNIRQKLNAQTSFQLAEYARAFDLI